MKDEFDGSEKLYRAVYPKDLYQKRGSGRISSAAFLDRKGQGLSVDRGNNREDAEVVNDMRKRLHGCILSVRVEDCRNVKAIVLYKPSHENKYHSEIHGSEKAPLLSAEQRLFLASTAKIVSVQE